jgi:hypothetical protein
MMHMVHSCRMHFLCLHTASSSALYSTPAHICIQHSLIQCLCVTSLLQQRQAQNQMPCHLDNSICLRPHSTLLTRCTGTMHTSHAANAQISSANASFQLTNLHAATITTIKTEPPVPQTAVVGCYPARQGGCADGHTIWCGDSQSNQVTHVYPTLRINHCSQGREHSDGSQQTMVQCRCGSMSNAAGACLTNVKVYCLSIQAAGQHSYRCPVYCYYPELVQNGAPRFYQEATVLQTSACCSNNIGPSWLGVMR